MSRLVIREGSMCMHTTGVAQRLCRGSVLVRGRQMRSNVQLCVIKGSCCLRQQGPGLHSKNSTQHCPSLS